VQVARMELQACLVRIMSDFSKLLLCYFLVSCTSLYFWSFSGWPRDSDFFSYRRTRACHYHFISFLLEIDCHFFFFNEVWQKKSIKSLFVAWMFFVWQGYSSKFYGCTSSTHYRPIWNTSCFASDVNWSSWNHSFRSIWNLWHACKRCFLILTSDSVDSLCWFYTLTWVHPYLIYQINANYDQHLWVVLHFMKANNFKPEHFIQYSYCTVRIWRSTGWK